MPRKRKHPLAQIVIWMGVCLTVAVALLAIVVAQLPSADMLDSAFLDGLAQGNVMCLDQERQFGPVVAPQPSVYAPVPAVPTAKGGLI